MKSVLQTACTRQERGGDAWIFFCSATIVSKSRKDPNGHKSNPFVTVSDRELAGQARAAADAVAEDFKHSTATSDWLSR